MAFINNTPMIVGGGTPTPTPTTKKYKLKKVDIQTTISQNQGTIYAILPQNEYMTNFWQWLNENSCPGLWELVVKYTDGSGIINDYGLTPSYPNGGVFGTGNLKINFTTNESYKADAYERVQLNNAEVEANSNILTFTLSNLVNRKDTPDKNGFLTTKRSPITSKENTISIVIRLIVLEESEE